MKRHGFVVAISLVCFAVSGCNKKSDFADKLGNVTGTVTLDGSPMADALVSFSPSGEGGSSSGRTNEAGVYTMTYAPGEPGAWIGDHQVAIDKEVSDDATETTLQYIPPKYRGDNSELTASVQTGENTIDFALTADGYVPKSPYSTEEPN